jgi:hypothetical protein
MIKKVKEAKKKVDALDVSKFKSQCCTTWEVKLKDGTLYKRGELTACFAQAAGSIAKCLREGKEPKTLTYFVEERRQKDNLTDEERVAWFKLLQDNKIITSKEDPEKLVKEGITFDVTDESLSPCSLYLELSLCRYINEEPAVVRSMFILMKAGLSFAHALGYAQNSHGKSSGHMVLPYTGGVYSNGMAVSGTGRVLTLSTFIKNRVSMDERQVLAEIKEKGSSPWRFHVHLNEKNKDIRLKDLDSFLSEEMVELFNCDTAEDIEAKVKESKEKGESIFV